MGRPPRQSTIVTKTFADRLSQLVEEKKKAPESNHAQIAADIGVSSGALSEWCSDNKTISISQLPTCF